MTKPKPKQSDVSMDDFNILQEAAKIIGGDRRDDYGPVEVSFERISDLWTTYLAKNGLDVGISAQDVAMMMILFKIAREMHSHKHDNLLDIIGYAALADSL